MLVSKALDPCVLSRKSAKAPKSEKATSQLVPRWYSQNVHVGIPGFQGGIDRSCVAAKRYIYGRKSHLFN